MDQDFAGVINGCAERSSTWITPEMRDAYIQLHALGHAHSVEVWDEDHLVGGLYGVAIGRIFYGESMFSRVTDASKIALVHLCGQLRRWGFRVIDCQVGNDHTRSLGAITISRSEFVRLLTANTEEGNLAGTSPWQLQWFWRDDSTRP